MGLLLTVPRKKLAVWLLYRGVTDISRGRLRGRAYRALNNLIKRLLPPGRLCLLTDSELLSQSFSAYFRQPVFVMPVPHTDMTPPEHGPQPAGNKLVCWWPGPPRPEKGLEVIKKIMALEGVKASQLVIVVAGQSGLANWVKPDGVQVQCTKNYLSRAEYVAQLLHSDIVLLPYQAQAYRQRTSGIFVETIMANRIPVVTPQTWMAYELLKYNLPELVIDWDNPNLIDILFQLKADPAVKDKLTKMQLAYSKIHSKAGYAAVMQQLFQQQLKWGQNTNRYD